MFLHFQSGNIPHLLNLLNDTKQLQPSLRLIQILFVEDTYLAVCEVRE